MSASKSKNLIIIVLLLLNVILLAVLLFDKTEASKAREAEIAALMEVVEDKGIRLSGNIDFEVEAPQPCSIIRSEERDNKLVDKLFEYTYREDMGGNVIFYSSDKGEAVLRGTGEIDIIFHENLPELSGDYAEAAAKIMKRKGIELYPANAEVNSSGDGVTVIVPGACSGYCVYNSKLSFTVSGEKLVMINGTRVFDGETKAKQENLVDSVAAIMHFLDYVRSEGYICSSIVGLEAGYFMNVAVSGESSLRPVWRITTDTGSVYINAVSGKVETMPA